MIPGVTPQIGAAELQLFFQLLVKLLRRGVEDVLLLGELRGRRKRDFSVRRQPPQMKGESCEVGPPRSDTCGHPQIEAFEEKGLIFN